jgi:plasmid maintenance system antidote protein VapI
LSPNLVDCVEGTRANGLPEAEIPELHGLRWQTDNATITEAQRSSVKCDTALRLAHFFGTSAQFWLNLQSLDDLRLAQEKVGKIHQGTSHA